MDFTGFRVADLDGDGRRDLLVMGTDKFAVLFAGKVGPRIETLASYESPRADAFLGDLIAGDLNGDGRIDMVIMDTAEHMIELVASPDVSGVKLERALTFKVFDTKSFSQRDSLTEPRDMTIGDVDGDGLLDLILLVHDRILIYRQEPASVAAADGLKKKPEGEGGR
jgi:hypothetical protein